MAMKRYKYSKTALTLGLTICENRSCTRMNVCSGSISLSLSLSGRRIFPREWQKTSKLLTHFFSLLSILFPQDTFQTMRIILIRKKKGQLVFTFSLVLTKTIHSFLQYSTVLYESGKFLNNMFGWVEEGKKMRKKKRFLYVWDLERVKVERE